MDTNGSLEGEFTYSLRCNLKGGINYKERKVLFVHFNSVQINSKQDLKRYLTTEVE